MATDNFSQLETKEDSLEQVLRLAGMASKFKLRAQEFNLIRAKLNHLKYLYDNLELSGGGGILGIDVELYKYTLTAEPSSYAAYINTSPLFEVAPGIIPKFRFFIKQTGELPKVISFSLQGEQQGMYGNGGSRLLSDADLFVDFERIATADELEDQEGTQIVTFPNLSGNVNNWLDAKDPAITLQPDSSGIVIFRGTILGEPTSYLFVGPRGNYGVGATNDALPEHFEPLRESDENITIDKAFSATSLNPLENRIISVWKAEVDQAIQDLEDNVANINGLSAYELWLEAGNTGTVDDFLLSRIGPQGDIGPKGDTGDTGLSAYQVWLNAGNTGTEQDFIDSLQGVDGVPGTDGDSAYQVWLSLGNTGTEQDFIDSLQGQDLTSRTNTTVTKTNDTYTLQASDVDKRLFIPAPCTVIVPNVLAANLEFQGKQTGVGDVEFVAETGGTLNVNAAFQKFTEGEHAYWGIVTLGGDEADLLGTLKLAL